jgi:hypothetical protein
LCDAEKKKAWELQLEEMKRQQEEKDREILKNARVMSPGSWTMQTKPWK